MSPYDDTQAKSPWEQGWGVVYRAETSHSLWAMKSPRVYSAPNFRKGSDRKGTGVNERAGRMVWARD